MKLTKQEKLERQKKLYQYLQYHASFEPEAYIPQESIGVNVEGYKYVQRGHNTFPSIWSDIQEINSNSDFEKIIVGNGKLAFRFALNEDEVKAEAEVLKTRLIKLAVRINRLNKKAKLNGQGVFSDDELRFIEAFATDEKEAD